MDSITISTITSSAPEYNDVWELREEVLRKPLGMSLKNEDLSMDAEDTIFIAKIESIVIGCLMLHEVSADIIKLRQMAVYTEWQGRQTGRMLVAAAEQYAKEKGYSQVTLHARRVAEGFYSRLGYLSEGNEFTEVGIPHVVMNKRV